MKECASCGSNEIVTNVRTGKTFCYDCKSERVYGKCYRCGQPIKEEGCKLDGSDNWHEKNQVAEGRKSCWEEHKIDEMVDSECS